MLFNSYSFFVFFAIVLIVSRLIGNWGAREEQKMYAEEESRHWNNSLIRIRSWVDRIRARGGKVLFIRMPGDGDFAEDPHFAVLEDRIHGKDDLCICGLILTEHFFREFLRIFESGLLD